MINFSPRLRLFCFTSVIVLVSLLAYWPGLSGGFLFDDFANLDTLGNKGGVTDWPSLLHYLNSGGAGPTGRPISLLSFLIDGRDWPTDPLPFKRTNLLLHLLNGLLLISLLYRLLNACPRYAAHAVGIAVLAGGLWLLHPINVSTTLYPVQRMTQLAALFVLLGFHAYLHGRLMLARRPRAGHLWMTAGVGLGTLLAVFSKENGVLLPLLLLVLEATLLSQCSGPRPDRRWHLLFIVLPSLLLITYLAEKIPGYLDGAGYRRRDFDLIERLLTQARILFDYLRNLWLPRSLTGGLYHDDIVLSRDLLTPPTTLPAVLGIFALAILGWLGRRRLPLLSAAILFFLAGHLLESTVIPLELYFEHRNYLPAMLMFLPLAGLITLRLSRRLMMTTALLVLGLCTVLTWHRATLWGDSVQLTLSWAQQSPASPRAQRTAAITLDQAGRPDLALQQLDQALIHLPSSLELKLHRFALHCQYGISTAGRASFDQLLNDIGHDHYDLNNYRLMEAIIDKMGLKGCLGLGAESALRLLDAVLAKPEITTFIRHQLLYLRGKVLAGMGRGDDALHAFQQSLKLRPRLEAALQQVAILGTHAHYAQGLILLEQARTLLDRRSAYAGFGFDYAAEIGRLERQLRQDMGRRPAAMNGKTAPVMKLPLR